MLESDIRTRFAVETRSDIREEMRFIRLHLESDEKDSLRFRITRPLLRVSGSDTPAVPLDSEDPSFEESVVSAPEVDLTRSFMKNCRVFSLRSIRKFSSSYHSAGLFDDCKHAFFNNDSEVSVYRLGDLRCNPALPKFSKVFTQKYKNRECIRNVTSSQSCIIIATNKRLLSFNLDAEAPIDTIPHGVWDPSGLACYESETHWVVFFGQSQRNKSNKYNGQISVYTYKKGAQADGLSVLVLELPANDCPKRVSFHTDSHILTCITRLENKVLVWKLDDDFSSSSEPFEYLRNKYTQETGETGVTSATVYQSPTARIYVLCTTAPSTERYRHDGEWSFILLIPPNAFRQPPHPSTRLHTFEQLDCHRPLYVGCSSSQHHVFAILENSGRLSFLRLNKHKDGAIHSREKNAEKLLHSLCKQDRPLTDCLRFDPSGDCLFAVDPKGKIIVTEFEK